MTPKRIQRKRSKGWKMPENTVYEIMRTETLTTIWKYPFELGDIVTIEMPLNAVILSVQIQHGRPSMWAQVDPKEQMTKRYFEVVATGGPIPAATRNYIGTIQMAGGNLVFHVFELLSLNH